MHFMVAPKVARWPICSITGRYADLVYCCIMPTSSFQVYPPGFWRILYQHSGLKTQEAILNCRLKPPPDQLPDRPIIILDIQIWHLLQYHCYEIIICDIMLFFHRLQHVGAHCSVMPTTSSFYGGPTWVMISPDRVLESKTKEAKLNIQLYTQVFVHWSLSSIRFIV